MDQLTPVEQQVMRAITARYHKQARAERSAAQEAYRAKTAPAPSTAGWDSRPGPKRKPTSIERDIEEAARASRRDWARQHPEAARAERAMRIDRAETTRRWDHKREGTAQTHEHHARQREGAMRRLYLSGAIDSEQLDSSAQIAGVAEQIGHDVAVRTASLETRIDATRRGDGAFWENLYRVRLEVAYGRWRAAHAVHIAPLLEIIVGDLAITAAARRYRMGVRRTRTILIDALDAWPAFHADARREIDPATLAAAQAGVLG